MTSRVLRTTVFLITFIAGVLLLFEFFSFDNWKALTAVVSGWQKAPHSRVVVGILAIALLLIPLVAFQIWNRRRLRLASFRIPTAGDPVYIRLRAIAGFVSGVAEEHPGVEKAEAVVRKRGAGIDIDLHLKIFNDRNLLVLTEALRESVWAGVSQQLGIPQISRISVVAKSVTDSRML